MQNSRALLAFHFEKITFENFGKWEKYFNQQKEILDTLLAMEIWGHKGVKNLKLLICNSKAWKKKIYKIFGENACFPEISPKVLAFLEKIGRPIECGREQSLKFIESFDDGINVARMSFFPEAQHPGGLYVAYISLGEEIVMSVLVAPTPSNHAQIHKGIFTSLSFLVSQAMQGIPSLGQLSPALHSFAACQNGAAYIVTSPVHRMHKHLIELGFLGERESGAFKTLTDEDREYIRYKTPIDTTVGFIYHINDQSFKDIYLVDFPTGKSRSPKISAMATTTSQSHETVVITIADNPDDKPKSPSKYVASTAKLTGVLVRNQQKDGLLFSDTETQKERKKVCNGERDTVYSSAIYSRLWGSL